MSVSIAFYLEVRRDEKWSLLRWKQPTELETYCREEEPIKWRTRATILYCDYRFIDDFIEHYSQEQDGLPDDVTPELKRMIRSDKNSYGTGYFDARRIWEYLNEKRDEMLASLIQSRDYQMVYKLNKIEAKLFGEKESSPIDLSDEYYKRACVRDLYESYENHVWGVRALAQAINSITSAFWVYAKNKDMRVVFQLS